MAFMGVNSVSIAASIVGADLKKEFSMFKGLLATTLVLASASLAQANDSAFAKIRVKAISPGSLKAGQPVKFHGVNADKFFEMLPSIAIAGSEEEQKQNAAASRYLAIVSGKNSINISCSKKHYDEKSSEMVKNANGTECRIELSKPETEGDSFDYAAPVCK
jgi:hypothetical protein